MLRVLLLSLLVAAMSFSGCLGGDTDDDPGPTAAPGDDENGDDNETGGGFGANVTVGTFIVTIQDAPTSVDEGAPINVTWRVESGAEGSASGNASGNGTSANATFGNETLPLAETGIAWGFMPVPDPNATDDYPNNEVADQDTEAPGEWNLSFTPDGNGTGNGTGGGNGTNGTTLYLRAYAVDENGTVAWSQEVEVQVVQKEPITIEIGAGTLDGPLAGYSPPSTTVKVGQPILWSNVDSTNAQHTATSSEGPGAFDTGQIAAGETSEPIVLTEPGTYTYSCTVHATMADATIIVEA